MDFTQIATNFGLPVAMLAVLVFGLWRGSSWVATNVLHPLTVKHIEFIETTRKMIDEQTKLLSSLTSANAAQANMMDVVRSQLKSLNELAITASYDMKQNNISLVAREEQHHEEVISSVNSITIAIKESHNV